MTLHDEALEDAGVARVDSELIAAGIAELEQLLAAHRLDALSVSDVARDVLPRLDALRAYLLEQVVEVTA